MKFIFSIFLCVSASIRSGGALLLSPRQMTAGRSVAMLIGPNTNRVDYVLASRAIGTTIYRYHGKTWATNVFTMVDVTNIPTPPMLGMAISWDAPVVLLDSPDLQNWQQLTATGTMTVKLPLHDQDFFCVPVPDQTARVHFDASPDPTVTGNFIYYGGSSQGYTNRIDAGTNTDYILTGLSPGAVYYITASAHDNDGQESAMSNEAVYIVPAPKTVPQIGVLR